MQALDDTDLCVLLRGRRYKEISDGLVSSESLNDIDKLKILRHVTYHADHVSEKAFRAHKLIDMILPGISLSSLSSCDLNKCLECLQFATCRNCLVCVDLLVQTHPEIISKFHRGPSTLRTALELKNVHIAQYLTNTMEYFFSPRHSRTVLHVAIEGGMPDIASQIVSRTRRTEQKLDQLLASVLRDPLQNMVKKYLSERGLLKDLLNSQDPGGSTALHLAAEWLPKELAKDMCEFLIAQGADPHVLNGLDKTYLDYLKV